MNADGRATPEPLDDRLQALLGEYVDRLNAGDQLATGEIIDRHPDEAPEIIESLRAFIDLEPEGPSDRPLGVLGDYRILKRVGRGGMGVVYEAWQVSLERRVALKVLPAGFAADSKAFGRFVREARVAGKLQHPAIVPIHAMGLEADTPFFAMEFVEGETLAQLLDRKRAGKPRGAGTTGYARLEADLSDQRYYLDAAEAFAGAAEGLAYAHAQGVVHRDLKPSNLILDPDGRLRILDFGLARLEGEESLTKSGDILGTLLYMSPEQARARRELVDRRSDIYSLGATLHEVVVHLPPFQGKDHQETLSQIISRDAPGARRSNPRVPRDLETIILKCLEKSPAARYATAEALAQDLRRFVRGDPIEARPLPFSAKIARQAWKRRRSLLLLASVLLLAAVSMLYLRGRWREEGRERAETHRRLVLEAVVALEANKSVSIPARKSSESGAVALWAEASAAGRALVEDFPVQAIETAIGKLERAAGLFPERPDARYHLARALHLLGRDEEAARELRRALAVDRSFIPARELFRSLPGQKGEPPGSGSDAAAPPWARAWLDGHLAVKEKRWRDAAEAQGRLIALVEGEREPYVGLSLEARLGRGRARRDAGDLDGALADFAAAEALWPTLLEPAILVGETLWAKGEEEAAHQKFEELYARAESKDEAAGLVADSFHNRSLFIPALLWAYRMGDGPRRQDRLADYYYHYGDEKVAIQAANRLIEMEPDSAIGYWRRGSARRASGDFAGAIADLSRAIELKPDSKNIQIQRGWTYLGKLQGWHDYAASLRDFDRAIALSQPGHNLYYQRSNVRYTMGDLPGAEEDLLEDLKQRPENHDTDHNSYFDLAMTRFERKDFTGALKAIGEATRKFPRHGVYWYWSALLREKMGDLDGAIADLTEVLKQEPDHDQRYLERANLQLQKGDSAAALAGIQPALAARGRRSLKLLSVLAEIQERTALPREAVCTLERANSLPDFNLELKTKLANLRRSLAPDLPSFATVDAAIEAREALVPAGAAWRFFRGRSEPSPELEWTGPAFDDGKWEEGPSGFGYADGDDATLLEDMKGSYTTLYLRKHFEVPDPSRYPSVELRVRIDDGFIAYLNGEEVGRFLAGPPGVRASFQQLAENATVKAVDAPPIDLRGKLRPGENLLAIQGLNSRLTSLDFTLIPVLEGGALPPLKLAELGRSLLVELERVALGAEAAPRRAYLEGRILALEGKSAEAIAFLEEAGDLAPNSPEPPLRIAEILAADGEFARAEAVLRRAIEREVEVPDLLWERWIKVTLFDLRRSAFEALGSFPIRAEGGQDSRGGDLLWALEGFARDGVLRISSGSEKDFDLDGIRWSHDRFFRGGESYRSPVLVTGDQARLYRTGRAWGFRAPAGYRIPAPLGRYRVTLHFAETRNPFPGERIFQVLLEGKLVLDRFEPLSAGLGTATIESFEIEVKDGAIDLDFLALVGDPRLAALEVNFVNDGR